MFAMKPSSALLISVKDDWGRACEKLCAYYCCPVDALLSGQARNPPHPRNPLPPFAALSFAPWVM
jgi:hypothetical protein